jgi:RNA recognition motif-containing protein
MANNSEADAAIKALNGTDMKGRNITVNQAKPKSDRPSDQCTTRFSMRMVAPMAAKTWLACTPRVLN